MRHEIRTETHLRRDRKRSCSSYAHAVWRLWAAMALSRAVRAQVLTSDRSMSLMYAYVRALMCVPSHTHTTQPGQLKTFGFRGTKTSWLQLVTTNLDQLRPRNHLEKHRHRAITGAFLARRHADPPHAWQKVAFACSVTLLKPLDTGRASARASCHITTWQNHHIPSEPPSATTSPARKVAWRAMELRRGSCSLWNFWVCNLCLRNYQVAGIMFGKRSVLMSLDASKLLAGYGCKRRPTVATRTLHNSLWRPVAKQAKHTHMPACKSARQLFHDFFGWKKGETGFRSIRDLSATISLKKIFRSLGLV